MRTRTLIFLGLCPVLAALLGDAWLPSPASVAQQPEQAWFRDATREYGPIGGGPIAPGGPGCIICGIGVWPGCPGYGPDGGEPCEKLGSPDGAVAPISVRPCPGLGGAPLTG